MTDQKDTRPPRWKRLWERPAGKLLLGIPLGAFLFLFLGVVFYAGAGTAMQATSSHQFCAYACHEMEAFVTPGWKESVHGSNASGVQASCPDCHVPGPAIPKLQRKAAAIREGYHHVLGTISTQEKFDAHALSMAQRVWTYMEETDSRECRACHDQSAVNAEEQGKMAQRVHQRAAERGQTCIECHKGVAHPLPAGYEE